MGNKINVDNLVEIKLRDSEDFLKIKETLTRIGISSRKENKLYQSCHILHKKGRYYIVHFKELFLLDGLRSDMDKVDEGRRNTITNLLVEWDLCELVDTEKTKEPTISLKQLKIISYKEKNDWELCPKYHIGKKY